MQQDEILTTLLKWLRGVTGITIIKAHQSGKIPELPYGVLNITFENQVNNPADYTYETVNQIIDGVSHDVTTETPVQEYEFRFSFNVYGNNAVDIMRKIKVAFEVNQYWEELEAQDLNLHRISPTRNLPEQYNNSWHPRAQVDLYVRVYSDEGLPIETTATATAD